MHVRMKCKDSDKMRFPYIKIKKNSPLYAVNRKNSAKKSDTDIMAESHEEKYLYSKKLFKFISLSFL